MCGFELKRGQVWGPKLTSGRTSDHQSPFKQEVVQPGSLSIHDLGYFDLETRVLELLANPFGPKVLPM